MATNEEVENLKKSWLKDPCWDIEDTEGFGDRVEELLAFRKEQEAEWQLIKEEKIARRARVVAIDTGILNSTIAQSIRTFEEIEYQATRGNNDGNRLDVEAAQVRATLLLAAQVKRIADALEARNESDEADGNQEFMTRLYKVE